jgi:hypothetical protein
VEAENIVEAVDNIMAELDMWLNQDFIRRKVYE